MKNLKIKYLLGFFILASIFLNTLSSCSNDDDKGSSGPIINSVSPSVEGDLVPVTIGKPKNVYVIQGSGFNTLEKIYFNDFETYFNPTLVTDNAIFVTIDEDTPFSNVANELKIVTKSGTVIHPFIIAPPDPTLLNYSPINPLEGEVITIKGNYFLEPIVKIGDVPATIISSTLTEIKVKVPAGANNKYVSVTNISGTATSKEAIGTALFDDAWSNDWFYDGGDDKVTDVSSPGVLQGELMVKSVNDGWSGTQFRNKDWATIDVANYKGIRISIKGAKVGKVALILNGHWSDPEARVIDVTTEWKEYNLPWTDWPFEITGLQTLVLKDFTGEKSTYYLDNIGFILK